MTTPTLPEWQISIVMSHRSEGVRRFELRIPAVNEDLARAAAYEIGLGINTGSDHAWKVTDYIDVTLVSGDGR